MFRACELKDQTYKKTRTLHFSDFVQTGLEGHAFVDGEREGHPQLTEVRSWVECRRLRRASSPCIAFFWGSRLRERETAR